MYGFIDESGTPGIKNEKDAYLGIALVFFDSLEDIEKFKTTFSGLRKHLGFSSDYEFHACEDMQTVHKELLKAIASVRFHYACCTIKKDSKDKQVASYKNISKDIIGLISKYHLDFKIIRMDQNPTLKKQLQLEAKAHKLHLPCKEVRSSSYDGVQLADYIVYTSTRKARGLKLVDKTLWKEIEKKRLA